MSIGLLRGDDAGRELRYRAAVAGLVVVGALIRLIDLGSMEAWHDEVWVVRLVNHGSIGEVVDAARGMEGAVPAFLYLMALHGAVRLLGTDPFSIRVLSFAAGGVALLLTCLLARKFLGRRSALVATGLVTFSPFFIYYSEEAKQYSFDMMCALLVLVCAERVFRPRPTGWNWSIYLISCVLAGAASYTTVFVFPAVFLVALTRLGRDRWLGATGAFLGQVTALTSYALMGRETMSPGFEQFWSSSFAPEGTLPGAIAWHMKMGVGLINSYLNPSFGHLIGGWEIGVAVVATSLFVLGSTGLRSVPRRFACYAILPMLLLLIANWLDAYPISARLVLFLAPLPIMILAHAPSTLARAVRSERAEHVANALGILLVAAVGWWLFANPGVFTTKVPRPLEWVRSIRAEHPNEGVYVHSTGMPNLVWGWWPPSGRAQSKLLVYPTRQEYEEHIRRVVNGANSHFWLVHVHPFFRADPNVASLPGDSWTPTESHHHEGVEVIRFERIVPVPGDS